MATSAREGYSNLDADMRNYLRRWYDFSNDVVSSSMKIGRPVLAAYVQSYAGAMTEYDRAYRKSCQIPETDCPPYCVCEMEWEAYEGDTVSGTIDVHNAGKQASQFALSADNFRSAQENTPVKAEITPAGFSLAPGETKKVVVTVNLADSLDPNESYQSEIKIAGRYEQCVRLSLAVRKKMEPYCKVEHGEIPTRIVAHHWYDHFQCEELCFEPIQQRARIDTPEKAVGVKKAIAKPRASRKKQ